MKCVIRKLRLRRHSLWMNTCLGDWMTVEREHWSDLHEADTRLLLPDWTATTSEVTPASTPGQAVGGQAAAARYLTEVCLTLVSSVEMTGAAVMTVMMSTVSWTVWTDTSEVSRLVSTGDQSTMVT